MIPRGERTIPRQFPGARRIARCEHNDEDGADYFDQLRYPVAKLSTRLAQAQRLLKEVVDKLSQKKAQLHLSLAL